jgi:ketosteroid isomerase-like protein
MEPSPELRQIIAGWFEAVSKGDESWVDRHVSRQAGVRLVGTNPTLQFEAGDVAEFMKVEVRASGASGGRIKASPGEPEAFREGSVGWGMTRPRLTLSDGKKVSMRWSGVFHQEDGEWKLVQFHASVGVANEALRGMEFAD